MLDDVGGSKTCSRLLGDMQNLAAGAGLVQPADRNLGSDSVALEDLAAVLHAGLQ